jgi:adenylate cyclase
MDYTIIGSEVNLASRLQSHAELGGILLSHETYSLVKDRVFAEERTAIRAKGIAKPVRNYAVIAPVDDLIAQGRAIHEEQDGLRVLVDFQKLDKAKAVKALESILARLKN